MQLCHLLIMYQFVSAKLNFETFCHNPYCSALHKAKGPNFGVYIVHQKGYVISKGLGGSSQSQEIQLIISSTNIYLYLETFWLKIDSDEIISGKV
jgi:hypothetical protein